MTTLPIKLSTSAGDALPPSLTTAHINNSLLHIHKIDAKSTTNSMAITVLNTSISSLETNVKKLERQVDEHKRLIVSTTTRSIPHLDTGGGGDGELTFVHLSTTGTLTPEEVEAAASDPRVLISTQDEGGAGIVEVPLEPPPEVLVHWDNNNNNNNINNNEHNHHHHNNNNNNNNLQEQNTTKIEDKVERHGSILIALIAALCVVALGCLGYVCLRWRCFIFPAKSGKVGPHATELSDVKAMTAEKPLPGR